MSVHIGVYADGDGEVQVMVLRRLEERYKTELKLDTFEIKLSIGLEHVQVTVGNKTLEILHRLDFSQISAKVNRVSLEGLVYTESLKFVY